jgi:glycosyltransferase involved in cell wall biosynthesis
MGLDRVKTIEVRNIRNSLILLSLFILKANFSLKRLSIVMPYLNEGEEPYLTALNILETTRPGEVEIIAVDDGSNEPHTSPGILPQVRMFRNNMRRGSGASKHLGASMAQTPNLLIIDAHMRFRNDQWLQRIVDALEREPQTVFCTTCVQLTPENMEMDKARTKYYGANLVLVNNDNPDASIAAQIIEPKWAPEREGDEYEIPCVLGANYAVKAEWFGRIGGMEGLQQWGGEEAFLSLKSWRAGGACKLLKNVEIGHRFRKNATYVTPIYHMYYNKMLICRTIFPPEWAARLENCLPKNYEYKTAEYFLAVDEARISEMRSRYAGLFVRSMEEICERLHIPAPL